MGAEAQATAKTGHASRIERASSACGDAQNVRYSSTNRPQFTFYEEVELWLHGS